MKTEQFNGENGYEMKDRSFKVFRQTGRRPKREIIVGMNKTGGIFIATKIQIKRKIITNTVVYGNEAVTFIMTAIANGFREWHKKGG